MRKFMFILSFIYFSCESLGVHEYDPNSFDYYDYVAYGWAGIFEEDYQLATNYFNQAINESEDVTYKNSAWTGLAWATTFSANSYFETNLCEQNVEECNTIINELRIGAEDYFDSANVEIDEAKIEYDECTHVNCFEDFQTDLELGELYLELLKYYIDDPEALDLATLKISYESFLFENESYDISLNKPPFETTFNFDYKNITVLLAQLLLREGDACAAEYYLRANDVCEEYSLGSDRLWNVFNETGDLIENDCGTLISVEFSTGNFVNIIDWSFIDENDNIIEVDYFQNNSDPDLEIQDGCLLDENTISYSNDSGVDHIIYNISTDIQKIKIQFDRNITGLVGDIIDNGFESVEGCYDVGDVLDDSADDACICEEIDLSLILECIQYNFGF